MSDLSMGWMIARTVGNRVLTIVRTNLMPAPRTIVQNIENAHGGFNQEDSLIFFAGPRSGFRVTVDDAGRTYVGELTDAAIMAACGRTPCEFARRVVAPPTAMVTTMHAARETLDCMLVEWRIPSAACSELMAIRLYENASAAIESRMNATVSAASPPAKIKSSKTLAKIETRPPLTIPVTLGMDTPTLWNLYPVDMQKSHSEIPTAIGWTHTQRCDPGTLTVVRGTDCWCCDNGVTHICARQGAPVIGFRVALAVTKGTDIQTYVGFIFDAALLQPDYDDRIAPCDFASVVRRIAPTVKQHKVFDKYDYAELKWVFQPNTSEPQPDTQLLIVGLFDEEIRPAPRASVANIESSREDEFSILCQN